MSLTNVVKFPNDWDVTVTINVPLLVTGESFGKMCDAATKYGF